MGRETIKLLLALAVLLSSDAASSHSRIFATAYPKDSCAHALIHALSSCKTSALPALHKSHMVDVRTSRNYYAPRELISTPSDVWARKARVRNDSVSLLDGRSRFRSSKKRIRSCNPKPRNPIAA